MSTIRNNKKKCGEEIMRDINKEFGGNAGSFRDSMSTVIWVQSAHRLSSRCKNVIIAWGCNTNC